LAQAVSYADEQQCVPSFHKAATGQRTLAKMDDAMRDQLLQSPEVQKAVAKAGEDALNNPEVQAAMVKAAQEKFPHMADSAMDSVQGWAQDPAAQEKAKAFATAAFWQAEQMAANAPEEVYKLLQQGPKGVRILAFIAGCCSFGVSVWRVVKFWKGAFHPFIYVMGCYQTLFCLMTMMFEANPDHIAKLKCLDKIHDLLLEYCKFLTTCFGRGMFYTFQGSLWVGQVKFANWWKPTEAIKLAVGLFLCFIGVLNFFMHWGVMPVQVVSKGAALSQGIGTPLMSQVRRLTALGSDWMHKDAKASPSQAGTSSQEIELGPPSFSKEGV